LRVNFWLFEGLCDFHRVGLVLLGLSMVFSLVSATGYFASFVRTAFKNYSQKAAAA
jgi:hypothetical protein